MAETRRLIFKNIIGDTKATIDAIQKYINENSPRCIAKNIETEIEEVPAESINRVLKAAACEETTSEISEIIRKL